MMKCFVDTNVLVYRTDRSNPSKRKKAQAWIAAVVANDALVLSAQSLREYYWATLRTDRSVGAVAALRREVAALQAYVPENLSMDRLSEAWDLEDRHRLNFRDAHLVASALVAGCAIFLSEDMNGGQKIETLTVVNPFTTAPEAVLGDY